MSIDTSSFPNYKASLQEEAEKRIANALNAPISGLFTVCDGLQQRIAQSKKAGQLEELYIYLWRYICLVSKMKKHAYAKQPNFQSRVKDYSDIANIMMDELSKLQNDGTLEKFYKGKVAAASPPPKQPASVQPTPPRQPQQHWEQRQIPKMNAMTTGVNNMSISGPTSLYPQPLGVGGTPAPASTPNNAPQQPLPSSCSHLRQVILPQELLKSFQALAQGTLTRRPPIEFLGILAGRTRQNRLEITHLVIPRQTASSDQCAMVNEMNVFNFLSNLELGIFGWIHTHPEMDAFLSSVDLHTHSTYQSLLDESIAVVYAPSGTPRVGIFRIQDHALSPVLRCQKRGFHEHFDEYGRKLGQEQLFMDCPHVQLLPDPGYAVEVVEISEADP